MSAIKIKGLIWSVVLTLVVVTGSVGWACGRRHSKCCQPVYCQPVCCEVVTDGNTGTTDTTDTPETLEAPNTLDTTSRLPAPATLIVRLLADARLLIDGEPTEQTTSERTFVSPPLDQGRTYHYILTAEFMVDGVKEVVSKDIEVAAGRKIETTLDLATTSVAKN